MTIHRERTQTALLSPFAQAGEASGELLLCLGRADGGAPPESIRLLDLKQDVVIGRGSPAGVGGGRLLLDDPLVSGRHATLTKTEGGFGLRDEGSKNGTWLDGVPWSGGTVLVDGQVIFIGHHVFVYRRVSALSRAAIAEELASPMGPAATVSPLLADLCAKLRRLAPTNNELLLIGETGVGKEIYARAVHEHSGRRGRFVAINCAALPGDLVESELYGYQPGAHSTARVAKPGRLEEADGGTLFLDEVAEMAPVGQSKLLRFLQDREVQPLGSVRPRRLDVRVLAATNRRVAAGADMGLRDDLLARLGAAPLRIPSLRERREDLGTLIHHLLAVRWPAVPPASMFELSAFRALCLHAFPLNVRELEKMLSTAAALTGGKRPIELRDLPPMSPGLAGGLSTPGLPTVLTPVPPGVAPRQSPRPPPSQEQLEALLEQHEGNVAVVSRALGRQRAAVWRWIKQFGIGMDRFR